MPVLLEAVTWPRTRSNIRWHLLDEDTGTTWCSDDHYDAMSPKDEGVIEWKQVTVKAEVYRRHTSLASEDLRTFHTCGGCRRRLAEYRMAAAVVSERKRRIEARRAIQSV